MAAKPPKPPGSFLKSLLNQHNNNKNQLQYNNEDDIEGNTSGSSSCEQLFKTTTTESSENTKKTNCNCSNISIMHLFHEMKQEFPTIPDTIVAQCVNENCHQRENCIQMLRNELELNPIPAQSYPAKVLHPTNNNNTTSGTSQQKPPLQQKPNIVQQKPPLKPIKPIRTAPLQPPPPPQQQQQQQQNSNNSTLAKNTNSTNKQLSGEDIQNNGDVGGVDTNGITPQHKQTISNTTNTNSTSSEVNNNNEDCVSSGVGGESTERNLPPRQRPTTLNLNTQLQKQQQQQRQRLNIQLQQRFQEQRNRQLQQQQQTQNPAILTKPLRKAPLPPIAPKPSQFQLNNHTNNNNTNSFLNETFSTKHTTTTSTATSPLSESEISVSVSLSTPSPTSAATPNNTTHHHNHPSYNTPTQQNQQHLQTKSPIRHRSVITLQPEPPYTRDFLFTPVTSQTPASPSLAAAPNTAATTTLAACSSATTSPTTSVAGSQKSFTSVNLTLRPPVSPTGANSALQPSTIDITAGPGFSGASGGGNSLHYSSTSYDARLGYQQNFQITVTDEGGVFSACRLRPHHQQQQQQQQQQQKQRCLNQQQQLQLQQQQQQLHNNNVVALQPNIQNSIQSPYGVSGSINTSSGFGSTGGGTSGNISGNMCLPPQKAMDAPSQEILQRQKKKRDKLAAALREYKKRLGQVEQEINLLTGTIPTEGLSERLDEEITKLRRDCQDMLRSSNSFTQSSSPPTAALSTSTQQELAISYQPHQQQQPQPFPRQKQPRPAPRPPPPPRQTSLDIIQHHSQSSTPHTPPAASLPNLNFYNSTQQQQHHYHTTTSSTPSYYHQQSPNNISNNNNNNDLYAESEEDLVDDVGGGDEYDDDEYEEVIEPWECSMCTFRNHPQLNICETCENVRIIPGRLTNLSRVLSATNCTNPTAATTASAAFPSMTLLGSERALVGSNTNSSSNGSGNSLNTANGNLEHDTNLVQQQLQHFALHT